ncbi:MAG TPA: M64 family metallopeptidase [Steroidobacteraceae bacterium]|nr:M64 family metallopeptidase [Steroidobacteraceae bacterium]
MPRFRPLPTFAICVPLIALCGCGGTAAEVQPAEANVISPGTAPVAVSTRLEALEDQAVRSRLQATDAEGDALTFAIVRAPDHAIVSLDAATGAFELHPTPNYFGQDAFEFEVVDRHGHAARARVDVSITPVQDPPAIDASAMASVIAAGRDARLHIALSDADGDAVTLSVAQVGGLPAMPVLEISERVVRFLAPDVVEATAVELLFEATDQTGLSTRSRKVITVSPVSPSGNLFTVRGTPRSKGLHWVITGDGFTADEQQELLRASIEMAARIAGAPELARHSAVLNVHVLTAISRDRGVTTEGDTSALRTAFEGTLGCAGVERVACVNWDKVYAAVLAERAAFDAVAVVLNTSVYAGSGSVAGLVVSRNAHAPAIALHEMGHSLAGLGDEYVDDTLATLLVPQYREGQFPNVTNSADPGRIPWRHWFTDSAHIPESPGEAGVGRFEGAFYAASGFYRPKQDSIMRSLGGAVGEVNAEAWLRAFYRAVPPVSAAYPAQSVVDGPAGATVRFELVSPWPRELMDVRWFVDGIEVEQARGAYRHELSADGGRHEVRVSIEDCSGSIRAPGAREHLGGVTWVVSNKPELASHKTQPRPAQVGAWIRMRVDSSGHEVLGLVPAGAQRAESAPLPDQPGFEYTLYDGGGAMLSQGRLADPRAIHGPLAPPGASETGHDVGTLEVGHYLIGIPEGEEVRRLRIRKFDGKVEKAAQSEQWLDL